jgi:hypothetical protein
MPKAMPATSFPSGRVLNNDEAKEWSVWCVENACAVCAGFVSNDEIYLVGQPQSGIVGLSPVALKMSADTFTRLWRTPKMADVVKVCITVEDA